MSYLANLVRLVCFWSATLAYGVFSVFYFTGLMLLRSYQNKTTESDRGDAQPSSLADPALGNHRFFKVQAVKLHYVEQGNRSNPLVLLIHGCPGFWFCWRRQLPALSEHYWVVAVDLRGCGDSETPNGRYQYRKKVVVEDIAQLIKNLGKYSANIICNETSGAIGWHLARQHPNLVENIIFINAPHPYVIREFFQHSFYYYFKYWYLLFMQIPILPEMLIAERSESLLQLAVGSAVRSKSITRSELMAYEYTFSRPEDWQGVLHHLRQIDISPAVVEKTIPSVLASPTMIIMGTRHPYLATETAYRSAEFVERIKVKLIEGAKDNIQVTHSKRINEEIINFFGRFSAHHGGPESTSQNSRSSIVGWAVKAVTSPYYTMLTKNRLNDDEENIPLKRTYSD